MRDYDKEIEELQKLQRIKIIAETKKRCLLKLENLLGRGEILITYNEGKRPIKIGSYRTSRIERSTFKTSAWTTKTVEGMVFETHPIYNENEYHLEIEQILVLLLCSGLCIFPLMMYLTGEFVRFLKRRNYEK